MKYIFTILERVYLFQIFLVLIIFFSINAKAQNPYVSLNKNHNSIYLIPAFSKLKNSSSPEYLISPPSFDFGVGYNYVLSIGRFYGFGFGLSMGYINYKLNPSDNSLSIYKTSSNILNLNFPFYINKYYPFNNRIALNVKTGININKLMSSLSNFGQIEVDGNLIYITHASINSIPQIGILFEIGGTYTLKNDNFLSACLVINKNFINVVDVNYEYYSSNPEDILTGSLQATASSFGLSIRYNFKTLIKGEN